MNRRITKPEDVDFEGYDTVVNAIGECGHPNISWCEEHPYETSLSNILVPHYLLDHCQKRNIRLIHIGTSYDTSSFYGMTKSVAEKVILQFKNTYVLKVNLPLDERPHERNFLTRFTDYVRKGKLRQDLTFDITLLDSLYLKILDVCCDRLSTDHGKIVDCVDLRKVHPTDLAVAISVYISTGQTMKNFTDPNMEFINELIPKYFEIERRMNGGEGNV